MTKGVAGSPSARATGRGCSGYVHGGWRLSFSAAGSWCRRPHLVEEGKLIYWPRTGEQVHINDAAYAMARVQATLA